MSWLDSVEGPSDAELWAIELEDDLLGAELRLVDAEAALAARPGRSAVAAYLQALLDVVDLHEFNDHCGSAVACGWRAVDDGLRLEAIR